MAKRAAAAPLSVAARERGRFSTWLQKRFFLRIHMSLILMATITAGVVATNVMLHVHLNRLWLRYAIAVLLAYGAFLFLVKCWLFYLGIRARRERTRVAIDCPIDLLDAVCDLGDLGDIGNSVVDTLENAGGRFGGGGSSGSWAEPPSTSGIVAQSGGGGGGGFDLGLDIDDGVLLLAIAAVLAIVVACIYLIYAAPAILSEAAFEAALGAALLKKAREAGSGNWVGSIVKATILPFLIIAALSTTVGWYAQVKCPGATRLHDALFCAPSIQSRAQ